MDFLLENIIPFILVYKYVALFGVFFLSALFIPFPSGNILVATVAFAVEGHFNLGLVVLISIFANFLGDNLGYWIARLYGEQIFSFIGFRRILESKTFNLIEDKFRRQPGFIIFISRFDAISTSVINLLAGLGKVSYRKYLVHESLGTLTQVCFYSLIGLIFRSSWQAVNTILGRISLIGGFILIVLIVVFWNKIIVFLKNGSKHLT